MPVADPRFEWRVNTTGYAWSQPRFATEEELRSTLPGVRLPPLGDIKRAVEESEEIEGRRLAPVEPITWRTYHPLEEQPDLFIKLGELYDLSDDETSTTELEMFCQTYGTLTSEHGNTWLDWYSEVLYVRLATELWHASVAGGSTATRIAAAPLLRSRRAATWWGEWYTKKILGPFLHNPSRRTAEQALIEVFNDQMSPHRAIAHSSTLLVRLVPATDFPELAIVPTTLLGAIWAQIADAITHGAEFRRCKWCGHGFQIRPGRERQTRIYCSPSCNTMAWRARARKHAKTKGR